jgi:hypothetical protein
VLCSGRSEEKLKIVEAYLRANKMFRNFEDASEDPVFSEVSLSHLFFCSIVLSKLCIQVRIKSTEVAMPIVLS